MQSNPAWAGYYSDHESETFTICFRKINLPRRRNGCNSNDSDDKFSPQLKPHCRGYTGIFPTGSVVLVAIMEISIYFQVGRKNKDITLSTTDHDVDSCSV